MDRRQLEALTMLEFIESSHTYLWDGIPVPNVTSIIADLTDLSRVPAVALEIARQEGVGMHKMVELYSKGELDEVALPEWLQPRLAAYKKFEAETGFQVCASEHKVYHPTLRYAGTLDLAGLMRLPKQKRDVFSNIDVKRSFFAGRAIGVQTAAYAEAWNRSGLEPKIERRFALQLRADGSYRLEEFADQSDFSVFLACLTLHNYRERDAA